MNPLTFKLPRYFFLLFCLLPGSLFAAQNLHLEGTVYQISASHININDMQFRILSTAKALALPENTALPLQDIKKGDYVRARLRKIDKRLYVDLIEKLPGRTARKGLTPVFPGTMEGLTR